MRSATMAAPLTDRPSPTTGAARSSVPGASAMATVVDVVEVDVVDVEVELVDVDVEDELVDVELDVVGDELVDGAAPVVLGCAVAVATTVAAA
jgi:hypothetical protein